MKSYLYYLGQIQKREEGRFVDCRCHVLAHWSDTSSVLLFYSYMFFFFCLLVRGLLEMMPIFWSAVQSCTAAAFAEVQGHSRPTVSSQPAHACMSCVPAASCCPRAWPERRYLELSCAGKAPLVFSMMWRWVPPHYHSLQQSHSILNLCSEIWTAVPLDGVSDGPSTWVFINNNSNLCVKDLRALLFIHVPLSVSRYSLFPFLIPNLSHQKNQCCHQL